MEEKDNDDCLRRPRRQLSGKQKKLELLEKMRSTVKGGKKNKYEIGELENVYEEVDEREYSKKVLQRQEDDWIVDDDGCGYVEDGREIFDDDLDEESVERSRKEKSGKKRSRSNFEQEGKKGNIRNLLGNMPVKKKKESNVKLDEDDILGDIINELDGISPKTASNKKKIEKEVSTRDYMKSLLEKKQSKKNEAQTDSINITQRIAKESSAFSVKASPSHQSIAPKKLLNVVREEDIKIKEEYVEINGYDESKVRVENTVVKSREIKVETMEENNLEGENDLFEALDEEELGKLVDETSKDEPKMSSGNDLKKEISQPENKTSLFKPAVVKTNIREEDVTEEWGGNAQAEDAVVNVQVDKSKLPLTTDKNGVDVFRFYYWDAHEEPFSQPGTVFLFGKVYIESAKSHVSCCISVKNIERRIFLLPRERKVNLLTGKETSESVSMADLYEEFNNVISPKYKIKVFRSRKIVKKYAFGKEGIPAESEYLEVRYGANFPALPSDLYGETFSCVFGTNTSFLELLILDRGIKGPGWIDIHNPEANQAPISWCKIEVTCTKPITLVKLSNNEVNAVPPLVLVTLMPFVVYNVRTKQSEVVAVSCLVNSTYPVDKPPPQRLFNQHFCVLSKPSDIPWPFDLKEALHTFTNTKIDKMESERALLNFLLTKLYRIDADIIIGHDLSGFGIEVLMERLNVHKVPNWSRFGRLRRSNFPYGKSKLHIERIALTGRLLCDIKISSKELIKSRSYDLDALCQNVLRFPEGKRPEMNEDIFKCSYSSGVSLLSTVWLLMKDASYTLSIFAELNVLPLALQITNIAGNVMSRTLMGGRSERNEYLLLHAFHNKDYIAPDKEYKKSSKKVGEEEEEAPVKGRKKPTYAGGLVLDPKVGLYDDLILLMDFNSLYPSIIQEYNICFTTIPIASIKMDDEFDNFDSLLPDDTAQPGILPMEIRKLVESRREVKGLLKNQNLSPELRMQYDIRQMALKLTANSMYGCLGFTYSRFFAKPLAALVTAKGREILMNTKRFVESYGHDVIYGDTDSLMINTRTKELDQVHQIGRKIKSEVNKFYKQVELDIDGIFKHMLLLRKKKYAAITITKLADGKLIESKEIKGLDMVRRDWSQLSAEVGKTVLDQILSNENLDDRIENIHTYLETIKEELQSGSVPLTLLTVTKQLTKPPEEYSDPKGQPHVQVALRLNSASAKRFKQGDTVSYVICKDGTSNAATQRAYHTDELKNPEKNLTIDTDYYLSQQIHPVIARLVDPIEGTDAARIALCLGLDPTLYRQKSVVAHDEEDPDSLFGKKEEERYKDCEKFKFICRNESCHSENIIEGPTKKSDKGIDLLVLEYCSNSKCNLPPLSYLDCISNELQLAMRGHIKKYYDRWLKCDDISCGHRTRCVLFHFEGAYPVCTKCSNSVMRREVTSLQLYNQLTFYSHMFDLSKITKKNSKFDPVTVEAYKKLNEVVDLIQNQNKYSQVDLSSLFSNLFPIHTK